MKELNEYMKKAKKNKEEQIVREKYEKGEEEDTA